LAFKLLILFKEYVWLNSDNAEPSFMENAKGRVFYKRRTSNRGWMLGKRLILGFIDEASLPESCL
jgi:hypothetical protein